MGYAPRNDYGYGGYGRDLGYGSGKNFQRGRFSDDGIVSAVGPGLKPTKSKRRTPVVTGYNGDRLRDIDGNGYGSTGYDASFRREPSFGHLKSYEPAYNDDYDYYGYDDGYSTSGYGYGYGNGIHGGYKHVGGY